MRERRPKEIKKRKHVDKRTARQIARQKNRNKIAAALR